MTDGTRALVAPKMKAYTVSEGDRAVVVFATNGAEASRLGASKLDVDFEGVDSCCRSPELDSYAVQWLALQKGLDVRIWVGSSRATGYPLVHVIPVLYVGGRPYVAYDPNYPEMFHFTEVPEFEAFSVVAFPGRFPDYQKPRLPVIAWSARRQQVVLIGN